MVMVQPCCYEWGGGGENAWSLGSLRIAMIVRRSWAIEEMVYVPHDSK